MRDVVADFLLPGRGIAMVEYTPTLYGETLARQEVTCRYIHWKDFLTNFARIWDEVWWIGYRVFLTRDEVANRWGREVANDIVLDHRLRDEAGRYTPGSSEAKATVWTIWNSREPEVVQVAPGYPNGLLGRMPPPVNFQNFFPCPRPINATVAPDSIYPVPDFAMYQDQADEVDTLTNRIYKLSSSLRLRGLYPADMDSVKRLLQEATDTELIPVDNWAMLGERGGADGLVVWFPLAEVAKTLATCIEAREKAKQALYEITGISDIVRGSSQQYETARAQEIKTQWGALRIRDRQRDVERFARDLIRLMAEVIAEHFNPETLSAMSGIKLLTNQQKQMIGQAQAMQQSRAAAGAPPLPMPQIPPEMLQAMNQPSWDDVLALLRNDKLRSFSIDVETDSTVELDQQAQQQGRTAFITAVTQFLMASAPILEKAPNAAPLLGQLLLFGVRGWKVAEPMETAIEQFVAQTVQQGQQPKPPTPDMIAAQSKAQSAQAKAQKDQMELQLQAQELQTERQRTAAEVAMDRTQSGIDMARMHQDAAIDQTQSRIDMARIQQEAQENALERIHHERITRLQHEHEARQNASNGRPNGDGQP
jgi:hypothetical protein